MHRLGLAAAAALVVVTACSNGVKRDDGSTMPPTPTTGATGSAAPQPATAKVFLGTPTGEIPVNVEVVSTPAKVEKGLMFREHLPPDDGMLFLMNVERVHTFWMKNTLISLDIIFIGKDMTVAGISQNALPRSEAILQVGKPSFYVLEVNGGWTAQHKVTAGSTVRFEGVPAQ